MSGQFRIDQIQFYVWALSQDWPSMPGGSDREKLTRMAKGYKNTVQASVETIDSVLEDELNLDAQHQKNYWLWVDRAIEAVGMLEADGLDLANRGKIFAQNYYKAHKAATHQNAFISLVKPNLEVYKEQIHESNIVFEAAPNHPRQDAQEIADFNDYSAEILNDSQWDQVRDQMIHDFSAYGSGCVLTDHRMDEASPDDMFLEERLEDGQPIEFEEYMRFRRLIKAHVVDYVDTFEVIAHRNAAGQNSWNIAESPQHPYVHWVRQKRVSWLKRKYPKHADKIQASTSDVYMQTNPKSFMLAYNDEDQATLKTTWIRFPVSYNMTIPVRLSNGDVQEMMHLKNRSAICRIDRIEGVGIVDMHLDRFAHNLLPICQAVNYPSMKHSRGIGLCKYGYAPQKVHQIMFNGRLRMFERMTKGGGWFFKDVTSKAEIQAQQKEGTWIGIDRKKLPPELANRPISDLVHNNSDFQFPSVYSQMEAATEAYVNTTMSIPPSKKGFKAGQSGRQDLALINQSDQASSVGKRNFEAVMVPLGRQIHSNIVQFDGDRYDIEFSAADPNQPGSYRSVVLNQVIHEELQFDPFAEEDGRFSKWKLLPTKIKNNLKSLRFSTQMSTRSLLPTNPTERRFFMNDFITRIFPLTETKRGIELLKWMVESGMGGLPGWSERIANIEASIDADRQHQEQMMAAQFQTAQQEQQFDQAERTEKLRQNLKRLEDSDKKNEAQLLLDLLDIMVKAAGQENGADATQLLGQAQNANITQTQ